MTSNFTKDTVSIYNLHKADNQFNLSKMGACKDSPLYTGVARAKSTKEGECF